MRTTVSVIGVIIALIGLAAVGFAFFQPVEINLPWIAKVAGLILGGGGLVAGAQFKDLPNLFKQNKPLDVFPVIDDITQAQDFAALNHLAERFRHSKDDKGLSECRIVNDRLFALHHPTEVQHVEVQPAEENSDVKP